jgi:hypothetical protein
VTAGRVQTTVRIRTIGRPCCYGSNWSAWCIGGRQRLQSLLVGQIGAPIEARERCRVAARPPRPLDGATLVGVITGANVSTLAPRPQSPSSLVVLPPVPHETARPRIPLKQPTDHHDRKRTTGDDGPQHAPRCSKRSRCSSHDDWHRGRRWTPEGVPNRLGPGSRTVGRFG